MYIFNQILISLGTAELTNKAIPLEVDPTLRLLINALITVTTVIITNKYKVNKTKKNE